MTRLASLLSPLGAVVTAWTLLAAMRVGLWEAIGNAIGTQGGR